MCIDDQRQLFECAIRPHLADAFRLARFLARSRADAEDILQEASIRALRGIGGMRGKSSRAWFLAVLRNTAYTWLARHRDMKLVPIDDFPLNEAGWPGLGAACPERAATPEVELIARAEAAALQAAIESLPEIFREVLVLRDIEGLTYREIAEVTNTPLGTVMSRLARARGRLLRQLGAGQADSATGAERT